MKFLKNPVARVFLLLAALVLLVACAPAQGPEPKPVAPNIVCTAHVSYQFVINDSDAPDNNLNIWEFASKDFSVYPTVYDGGWSDNEGFAWYLTAQSRADFDVWYGDTVKPTAGDIEKRLDAAFAVEGIATPTTSMYSMDLDSYIDVTPEAVCPEKPFDVVRTLALYTSDAHRYFEQVDVNDGWVTFVFRTPGYAEGVKGSVLQAKMPLTVFTSIVNGTLSADPSRTVTAMTLDYGSYSQQLTEQVYGNGEVEYASFSMLPEDQLAHDVIYEYLHRFASWNAEPSFIFINTLVNDDDGARLIGSLISQP